jgi:hypothetical protein
MIGLQKIANNAAPGGDGVAADLWASTLRYTVEGFGKIVLGIFPDLKVVSIEVSTLRGKYVPSCRILGLYSRRLR